MNRDPEKSAVRDEDVVTAVQYAESIRRIVEHLKPKIDALNNEIERLYEHLKDTAPDDEFTDYDVKYGTAHMVTAELTLDAGQMTGAFSEIAASINKIEKLLKS